MATPTLAKSPLPDRPCDGNLIKELTYVSYHHNRQLAPEITPEQWEKVFGPAAQAMEARFQCESPESERPYNGKLIPDLVDLVERAQKPKPPRPDYEINTPTDEERRERNAEFLNALWVLGEQMATQAVEIPQPKPDPLTIALNGFPDVNTYYAYQAGGDRD